jgi:hypothetical protein
LRAAVTRRPLRTFGRGLVPRRPTWSAGLSVLGRVRRDARVGNAGERHAVDWTLEYFVSEGYEVDDVGDTESYDVLAVGSDLEELHIEVKGSSGSAVTVNLTDGEVKHWSNTFERVLVVVDEIEWHAQKNGGFTTSGGRVRLWRRWDLDDSSLEPTQYQYLLPGAALEPVSNR